MDYFDWKLFFVASSEVLGKGSSTAASSASWCSWTTFRRLKEDAGYWTAGLPSKHEINENGISDASVWGQPFLFSDLAHVVIPREFYWENISENGFASGSKLQDIDALSKRLDEVGLKYRKTTLILEVKLY